MPKNQLPAEKYPRRSHPLPPEKSCGPAHTPPTPSQEAGGRGKGQTQPQRRHPLPSCKQASSLSPKTSWDSGWLTSAGRVTARNQLLRRHTWPVRGNWGWAGGGDKAHCTRGEGARQAPGCLSCSEGQGTKRRPNRGCTFVEDPETGTARNSGPAPWRAAWSLSSVDGKAHTCERGQNQCGWNTAGPLHTRQWHLSAAPSLPAARLNKQPKQETTSAHLCQGRN